MRLRLAICLGIVIAVAAAVGACGSTRKLIPVIGFQPEWASTSAISNNSSVLSSVGVDGLLLTGAGIASAVDSQDLTQLSAAQGDGLGTELLVANIAKTSGNFSEQLAWKTLHSQTEITKLAAALTADAKAGGWNGIMLDIEALHPRDASGLTALTAKLRADLPKIDTVSLTLSNNTSAAGYQGEGYDLKALAATGATLVLMAYDQHGPWEKQPGPVGALAWQRQGIKVLRKFVPAKHLILGVAGYGYAWEKKKTVALGVDQARNMVSSAGAHARWVPAVGEWTAKLHNGTVIWWADSRSFSVRVKLARKQHLGGMAVWSLPSTDPLSF